MSGYTPLAVATGFVLGVAATVGAAYAIVSADSVPGPFGLGKGSDEEARHAAGAGWPPETSDFSDFDEPEPEHYADDDEPEVPPHSLR